MTPFSKPALTIDDHIGLLKNRGMEFADERFAKQALSHISYYRLKAYCHPYQVNEAQHEYAQGSLFENVIEHYEFDRMLRLHLMNAIERVEISVRSNWVNVMKFNYGPHGHMNSDAFSSKPKGKGWSHTEGIDKLKEELKRSSEPFVDHFNNKYDEALPPIWASAELMSFGNFSKWYSNTRTRKDRNKVAKTYRIDEKNLVSFLHHLVIVRNHCAHHSRLWNRNFNLRWTLPTHGPEQLTKALFYEVRDKNDKYPEITERKLYNTTVMLAYFMKIINPISLWIPELIHLIEHHNIDPIAMGFPEKYKRLELWQS